MGRGRFGEIWAGGVRGNTPASTAGEGEVRLPLCPPAPLAGAALSQILAARKDGKSWGVALGTDGGVVQWQNTCFPRRIRGFDSRHRLQQARGQPPMPSFDYLLNPSFLKLHSRSQQGEAGTLHLYTRSGSSDGRARGSSPCKSVGSTPARIANRFCMFLSFSPRPAAAMPQGQTPLYSAAWSAHLVRDQVVIGSNPITGTSGQCPQHSPGHPVNLPAGCPLDYLWQI